MDWIVPEVLALDGRQRHAARHDRDGQIVHGRQGHHHGGQGLVAGGDAEDTLAPGQAADQPPKDARRIVAIGQAVHHSRRALRPTVTGVRAAGGEGHAAEGLELPRRGLQQQAQLIMPDVIADRDRLAVGAANPALVTEQQKGIGQDFGRLPPHPHVLDQAKEVAAGGPGEKIAGQRQFARRSRRTRRDIVQGLVASRPEYRPTRSNPTSTGLLLEVPTDGQRYCGAVYHAAVSWSTAARGYGRAGACGPAR